MRGNNLLQLEMAPVGAENPKDSDPLLDCTHSSSSLDSISEIKNDDVEAGSLPCCRICLECDSEHDDELISPCMCKGTQQFVHRSCLDHWRSVKEGFAFSHCTTCKAQFHLRVAEMEDSSWRKLKFQIFVASDVCLVFLIVQIKSMETKKSLVDLGTGTNEYFYDVKICQYGLPLGLSVLTSLNVTERLLPKIFIDTKMIINPQKEFQFANVNIINA